MEDNIFEKAKRDINLKDYIVSTCPVKANGNNDTWNIEPNPIDLQSRGNFKVSFKNGVWLYHAFNVGEGGSIIDFLQEKEGLKGEQLIDKLKEMLADDQLLAEPVVSNDKFHSQEDINRLIPLIDTTKTDYFNGRGISEEVIQKYKLGTSNNGILDIYSELKMKSHPDMKEYKHIIPCYDEEENLRFLVARNSKEIISDGTKKTWNIKGIPTYFLNQFYVEGYDIVKGDVIVLTESWGDSLAVESINNNLKVVSLHSVVNVKKLGELLTANREKFDGVKFIIAFNNDKSKKDIQPPGKVATNKAIKIMKALNLEYEVFMPTKYNDLNEWLLLDKKELENELKVVINKLNCIGRINLKGNAIEAFFSWIQDNLRYIVNCDDERRFLYWNEELWLRKTEEELRSLYGNFLKACEAQVEENREKGKYSTEEYYKTINKIKKWKSTAKAKECLSLVGYDERLIIDINAYKKQHHVYVSANGMIIDLKKGSIREAKKEDIILHASRYNLVDKDEATEFMENKVLKLYRHHSLGEERLEYILDFIAMKISGRNYQFAIINIGPSKSGKSMMKNLITGLFDGDVSHIPYAYLTTTHKGNMGAERDDIIVNLHNKKFCLASEAEKNNAPIAIGRFKHILSNSITDARATGGKMQNGIDLTHLDMIIDTNDMPSFSGYDDAIENRLLFINWQNSIPVGERIDNFNGEVLAPNMDKIWSYFIYRAIDLKDKTLVIPDIIKRDSAGRKGELDKLTFNVTKKLKYEEGKFIDLNTLIEELELFRLCPELKNTDSLHKSVTDRIKSIPGFEGVIQYRKGSLKIPGVKGIIFT